MKGKRLLDLFVFYSVMFGKQDVCDGVSCSWAHTDRNVLLGLGNKLSYRDRLLITINIKHVQYISIRDWTTESSSWVCYTNTIPYLFTIFEFFIVVLTFEYLSMKNSGMAYKVLNSV